MLIPLLDARHPLLWIRKGQGMAGIGEALRLEFTGPNRFSDACEAWRQVAAAATVVDPLNSPGTGLIAFGAFAFSAQSRLSSVIIVPSLVIGKRDGVFWLTRVTVQGAEVQTDHPVPPAATGFGPEYRISLLPGAAKPDTYRAAVEEAVSRINHGDLEKVVLARDLVGRLPDDADLRRVIFDLALGYPDCWTFAVDGLIGSSPETLVRVDHGTVSARVLAGTISRGRDAEADHDQAVALATSAKDLDEHRFAVASVMNALGPHSRTLATSEIPFTLKLPNLWHLASDVEGALSDGSTSLDLIASLHPTAAVAGTPTQDALQLIERLEPFDRGRYAGPVGWVGADGDGEWAVALRCAQVDAGGTITAYAGAGIVSESDPEHELIETKMKFRPMVEAFG
ncbi:isochorismate synthase [Subtercola boreus]|uniref:isochorismate synthase n=1 Tax=Subtercola boreus TaxID=120213 RepID=A0A3E0W8S3_9MICO|nr:isochorismate synthase [Subtercola boreus]RFA18971.1 isochorismate synthase [Subtercola boreus]RFA25506.1 isochorismate synthase [Subtercola boreus]